MYGSALTMTMSASRSFSYVIHSRFSELRQKFHCTAGAITLRCCASAIFMVPYPYHYQDEIELLRATGRGLRSIPMPKIGANRHNVRCFINSSQIAESQPACFALLIRFTQRPIVHCCYKFVGLKKITMKEKSKQRAVSIFN